MERDVDSARRAQRLRTLIWSLPGAVVGAIAGSYGAYVGLWNVWTGLVVGGLAGGSIAFAIGAIVTRGAGKLAGSILLPSGRSTPPRREYSYPESLAARGRYDEAITAYQVCCADYPDDPEPYVRIARLYRDHVSSYEDAIFWFKRARSETVLTPGYEQLITQEIIEVYTHKLGDPQRTIPELARLADRFRGDPIADWAKTQIAALKEQGRENRE